MGIGPLPPDTDPAEFVLSRFDPDEREAVEHLKENASKAVLTIAASGLELGMNTYNRKADT
jgi:PTH1 family peptidyl-tRNA hydrolase